ncbi:MAG: type 1 glutamine amidotransferase, partial [Chloroflexi bacterium]|nr:type 1 glutamine amidotransferase [Chloroflexota bacterium]
VGTFPVKLTADGAADELFGYLPQTFQAQLGRKDRAITLPDSVLHLAGSENAPFQAFRVPGKLIWGTQFHPELTKSLNLGRFRRYMEGYAAVMDPAEIQETINGFDESPEANQLVNRFMKLLFLQ